MVVTAVCIVAHDSNVVPLACNDLVLDETNGGINDHIKGLLPIGVWCEHRRASINKEQNLVLGGLEITMLGLVLLTDE
jgi:hypothetical protein